MREVGGIRDSERVTVGCQEGPRLRLRSRCGGYAEWNGRGARGHERHEAVEPRSTGLNGSSGRLFHAADGCIHRPRRRSRDNATDTEKAGENNSRTEEHGGAAVYTDPTGFHWVVSLLHPSGPERARQLQLQGGLASGD